MLIDSVSSENSPTLSVFLMTEASPTLETSCVFFIETMDTMQNATSHNKMVIFGTG